MMKKYLVGFFYSLPVQLLLQHFRRYQVLLIFWYILFATVSGNFLHPYGANSLFLAPEYMDNVSALSTAMVGFAVGIFIMSWNVTTFILHTKHIKFLATTAQPFLKFCINNAMIPLAFLIFYFVYAIQYDAKLELLGTTDIIVLTGGFLGGFILCVFISFAYFFSADKTIYRRMGNVIISANRQYEITVKRRRLLKEKTEIRVDWFLSVRFGLRKPRNVKHYSQEFLDSIFKRHHFAAIIAILLSFIFLMVIGFFSDDKIFQIPAAASITIFFGILIGVSGAVSLFLGNWSIPALIIFLLVINILYHNDIIDPRNKAYGINYDNIRERPVYSRGTMLQMVSAKNIEADKKTFLQMLQNWKSRQTNEKPVMFMINTSGGGMRSAAFTLSVLQKLDSITNAQLMPHTFLINGASGGLLGATYFRELYWQNVKFKNVNLQENVYAKNISGDLLNPLFTSMVSRDVTGPVRKVELNGYSYIRDRGYAFEQRFNENTGGLLDKKIGDYKQAEEEGIIPLIFFNSTITKDAREMVISTHPARFLMQPLIDSVYTPYAEPDAIDFLSFFQKQDPLNLRILSALRMNATFPYVLPTVWLPSNPAIDVMDAGLRDNFGQQTTLRFVDNFKEWLLQNTSRIVLIQISDRQMGDWDRPYEPKSILSFLTKPLFLLQNNWYRLEDYHQTDKLTYFSKSIQPHIYTIPFRYVSSKSKANAALSFHLTASEKIDIQSALYEESNKKSFEQIKQLLNSTPMP